MKNVYRLNYGLSQVTLALQPDEVTAVVRVWRDEMHVDHLQVVVEGRDAGGSSGPLEHLEIWFSGWLHGWSAKK